MREATREEYGAFIRRYSHILFDRATHTEWRSVMQSSDKDGNLRAQAIYVKGLPARYQIDEGFTG